MVMHTGLLASSVGGACWLAFWACLLLTTSAIGQTASLDTHEAQIEQLKRRIEANTELLRQLQATSLRPLPQPRRLPVSQESQTEIPLPPSADRVEGRQPPAADRPGGRSGRETDDALAGGSPEDEPLTDAAEQSPGVEERVDQLEKSVQGEEKTEGDFLEGLSTRSKRTVNGRIHLDHWAFPGDSPGINVLESGSPTGDPEDRFLNRRIRFGIRGKVPPLNVSYRVELEFSGDEGGRIRDAWLGWDDLTFWDTIRVGNQKRPIGLDHLNSSNFNVFMERPFIVESVNEDNRRLGVVSFGASDGMGFNWRYGIFSLVPIQNTNAVVSDRYQPELAGRLANTYWYDEVSGGRGYGHWAVSAAAAFPDDNPNNPDRQAALQTMPEARSNRVWLNTGQIAGTDSYQTIGLESVFNVGAFQVGGEFFNISWQRENSVGSDLRMYGGYLYLSYFLTGEHLPWNRDLGILGRLEPFESFFDTRDCRGNRARGIGAWQLATRFSYADLNDENVFGGVGKSVTCALNWHWNSHTRLQYNYVFGRVDDRRASLTDGSSAIVSGDYQISGLRFIIDF